MNYARIRWLALLPLSLLCHGCLTSTLQHYNNGRILEPGVTQNRWSLARTTIATCSGDLVRDSATGYKMCTANEYQFEDSTRKSYKIGKWYPVANSWRLGVRKDWGPFTGVDMGWAIEFTGTLEFDARFGLPGPGQESPWRHSIAAGWGIGNWSDNTWYLEYAASRMFRDSNLVYANLRGSRVATQLFDLQIDENESDAFASHQRWLLQGSAGFRFGPFRAWFLPRYYDFAFHFSTPTLMYLGGIPDNSYSSRGYPAFNTAISMGLTWQ